jgi:hypothetical protein
LDDHFVRKLQFEDIVRIYKYKQLVLLDGISKWLISNIQLKCFMLNLTIVFSSSWSVWVQHCLHVFSNSFNWNCFKSWQLEHNRFSDENPRSRHWIADKESEFYTFKQYNENTNVSYSQYIRTIDRRKWLEISYYPYLEKENL